MLKRPTSKIRPKSRREIHFKAEKHEREKTAKIRREQKAEKRTDH